MKQAPSTALRPVLTVETGMPQQIAPMPIVITRLLPMTVNAVGAFVFLDRFKQLLPAPAGLPSSPTGHLAHPHRGIVTLTYLLDGAIQHFDSCGNYGKIGPQGAQWMNSGKGIIHDEWPTLDTDGTGGFDGLQFWLNLQPEGKTKAPSYQTAQSWQLPVIALPANGGSLRIILGNYKCYTSPLPSDSVQFLYHVQLKPGTCLSINIDDEHEVAVLIARGSALINGVTASESLVHLSNEKGKIRLKSGPDSADIFVFGGEAYQHPIHARAQFVLNSEAELDTAVRDYQSGRYGEVDYNQFEP